MTVGSEQLLQWHHQQFNILTIIIIIIITVSTPSHYHQPSRGFQSSPTSNHQLYEGKLLQTDWWRKLVLTRVGRYIMTSPTHHHFAWHPESLCGVSRKQLTSTVNGENPGSWPRWSMHTSWMTPQSDNRALLSLNNSGRSWTVSTPDKVTAVPVRRNGNWLRSVFLQWDPNDVTHCRILPTDKTTQWLV